MIVTVTDENDNSPTFTENPYRASILETTRNGALVKQVLATDRDSGVNSKITYSITSQTPETRFVIDQQGRITLTGAVDYERYSSYTLNLQARDGGGRTDTSQLHITVQNVNERPSIKCNNGNCKYSVNENVQRGTGFGAKVIGTDPDTKTSCVLQYSLPSSVKTFSVHRTTGVILTNGDLDREKQSSYRFSVTVRDCGGLTNSIYVTVTVKDLNDNSPAFPGSYMVSILESEQPGSNVVQVRATGKFESCLNLVIRDRFPECIQFLLAIIQSVVLLACLIQQFCSLQSVLGLLRQISSLRLVLHKWLVLSRLKVNSVIGYLCSVNSEKCIPLFRR